MVQEKKKRNLVQWAMDYHQIVILITCVLIAFGIYGLNRINKNDQVLLAQLIRHHPSGTERRRDG